MEGVSVLTNKNLFLSFCGFMWIEIDMQIMTLLQPQSLLIKLQYKLFLVEFSTFPATLSMILDLADNSPFPQKLEIWT